ncbi:hypothetical protein DQ384_20880 [Sphaerisporangium album]|uniref:HEAT repeat domain-containing protein n=1 Tax=Sphaerisporangium album TaxID=509200 RepID=A0A367FIN2_9ACTN|nr:hypothetical protein [Sphaerisporangium album]RCG29490.1 hypothetical protein DQ384_20880 [Sphaerisporangium album]
MEYEEAEEGIPESLLRAMEANDIDLIRDSLVAATLGGADDWRWVQDRCLELCDHPNLYVREVAITCLGHLARIHGTLDLDRVMPKLRELKRVPETRAIVQNTYSDISIFIYRGISNVNG